MLVSNVYLRAIEITAAELDEEWLRCNTCRKP